MRGCVPLSVPWAPGPPCRHSPRSSSRWPSSSGCVWPGAGAAPAAPPAAARSRPRLPSGPLRAARLRGSAPGCWVLPPRPPNAPSLGCWARGRFLAAPRPLARLGAVFPYRCEERCCVPARPAGCSPAGLLAAPAPSHTPDLFDATPLAPRSFPQPLRAPHLLLMLLTRQFPGRAPAPCLSAPFLETQGTASSRPQGQQPQHPPVPDTAAPRRTSSPQCAEGAGDSRAPRSVPGSAGTPQPPRDSPSSQRAGPSAGPAGSSRPDTPQPHRRCSPGPHAPTPHIGGQEGSRAPAPRAHCRWGRGTSSTACRRLG